MPVLGELNEGAISIEEVRGAVNEMNSGKAPLLDGFPVECLMIDGNITRLTRFCDPTKKKSLR